jgi:signal transduction histidine kinase/CheY-like chemotaxis protein
MIRNAATFFQEQSGCEAVGIRLKEGDDYPYYETRGFPPEFVLLENRLCAIDEGGCVVHDSAGYPIMECMCGNVIQGRFDPSKPFFTSKGSFYSNCTTELIATTTEADRQARTRNRCNGEGYESVALIALRIGEESLGLLQLNDTNKGRFTPKGIVFWERLAGYLAVALAKFEAEEALKKAHDELEKRVQERTAELSEAYETLTVEMEERKKAEQALRQSHKMQAIGTLAGGIAHDFNNIIAGIIGFTEMALEDIPVENPTHRRLELVLKGAHRGRDLVKQILAFSRKGEHEKKPVSMGHIFNDALPLIRASLPSTIEIRKNILTKHDIISADQTQIHQVILNLCANAAYAMRDNGGVLEIILADENISPDEHHFNHGLEPGPYIRLTISDTGCGMEPEVLESIFDPFFTTKPTGEGTGLGLSVVHGIVKSHDGNIRVYSKPGQGSSFNIFIPKIESDSADEVKHAESIQGGKESILVVDDEDLLIEMSKQRLERLGYTIVGSTSSVEALEAFRDEPNKFDLVVTDYTMPHMTGLELARELLRIRPDLSIIMCSGLNEPVPTEKIREAGIQEFFVKPIGKNEFAQIIRRVLDRDR